MFRNLSQTQIHYRKSALSEGKAGKVHAGDRLPWLHTDADDNFAPLASLEWQLHVYGNAEGELIEACSRRKLALDAFPWSERAGEVGFARDAAYLVRPDGYVAWASEKPTARDLERYLEL
jgi:hypothetical protein